MGPGPRMRMADRDRPKPEAKPADKGEVKGKPKKSADAFTGPTKKAPAEVKSKAKKSKGVKAARRSERPAWQEGGRKIPGPQGRRAFAERRVWGGRGPWAAAPPGRPPWARIDRWGPPMGMGRRGFAGPMMGRYAPRGWEGWGRMAPLHRPPPPGFRRGFGPYGREAFPAWQPPGRGFPGPGRGQAFGGFRSVGRRPAGPPMFQRFPGGFREPGFGPFGRPGPRPGFRGGPPRMGPGWGSGQGPW
jgi:translation initiation factor IF-2